MGCECFKRMAGCSYSVSGSYCLEYPTTPADTENKFRWCIGHTEHGKEHVDVVVVEEETKGKGG